MSSVSASSGTSYFYKETETVFNATAFQAFQPSLDYWQRRIIQCVLDDNVEAFSGSCAETSLFLLTNIFVDDLQVGLFFFLDSCYPLASSWFKLVTLLLYEAIPTIMEYLDTN